MTETATQEYRHTLAGSDFLPRRVISDFGGPDEIHWFYEPRLRPGIHYGQTLCTPGRHQSGLFIPSRQISEQLTGGVPCGRCNVRWPLPTT